MLSLDKYPFLKHYFENGIKNPQKTISHSILFYGNDAQAQYELALYIAQLLNCKEKQTQECECLNCKWIKSLSHPAVLTISRIDNKFDDDESKTVISIKQAQGIKQSLMNSSDFHRVFIFCDKDKDGNISGLNQLNFQEETANALLKTIEEPPSNTTFIFLTRDKNDLISTIISRSQCFFVPSFAKEDIEWDDIKPIFENYFEFERTDVFKIANSLNDLSKNSIQTLEKMQKYILQLMKSNIHNKFFTAKFLKDIEYIEKAKKQVQANVPPLSAFENLCLNIIK